MPKKKQEIITTRASNRLKARAAAAQEKAALEEKLAQATADATEQARLSALSQQDQLDRLAAAQAEAAKAKSALQTEADARQREARVARDTFEATLPAFVNDNTLAMEYWVELAHWLVKTGQIENGSAHPSSTKHQYWTNVLAL